VSPLTIPNTFVAQTKAKASQVNANFAAVAAKFSTGAGGILDADCSTSMDLDANKLSSTAGKRLTAPKFEVGAVDKDALKKDATAGSPAAAVNEPAHIKDRMIPKIKLSVTAGEKITNTELDMLVEEVAFSTSIIVGIGSTVLGHMVERRITGPNYTFFARIDSDGAASGPITLTPTTPIPTATRNVIGVYLHNVTISASKFFGTIVYASIAKS